MRQVAPLWAMALVIGWYQLPVLTERTQTLPEGQVRDALVSFEEALTDVGSPARTLRDAAEAKKIHLQAALLRISSPVTEPEPTAQYVAVAHPVATLEPMSAASASPAALSPWVEAPVSAASAPSRQAVASSTPPLPAASAAQSSTSPSIAVMTAHAGLPAPAVAQGTVLLIGDSVMGEIAFGMKNWSAKHAAWAVVDAHKVSSGLTNSGYYDWPAVFDQLASAHKPKVVAMLVGANDHQDIIAGHQRLHFGSPGWRGEYAARAQKIVDTAHEQGALVYWCLPPTMKSSELERAMAVIREVVREVASKAAYVSVVDVNSNFVDTDGKFAETMMVKGKPRSLRADDGVHLTMLGAQQYVAPMTKALEAATPEPAPTPEVLPEDSEIRR